MWYLNTSKTVHFIQNVTNCFKIIKKCSSYNDLLSTGALSIKKLQLNSNNQLRPDIGSRVTNNIIK